MGGNPAIYTSLSSSRGSLALGNQQYYSASVKTSFAEGKAGKTSITVEVQASGRDFIGTNYQIDDMPAFKNNSARNIFEKSIDDFFQNRVN